jgi:hypothetical protein
MPRPILSSPRGAPAARSCAACLRAGSRRARPYRTASRTCQRCSAGSWCCSMSHLSAASVSGPSPSAGWHLDSSRRLSRQAAIGRPTPMTRMTASAHAMTIGSYREDRRGVLVASAAGAPVARRHAAPGAERPPTRQRNGQLMGVVFAVLGHLADHRLGGLIRGWCPLRRSVPDHRRRQKDAAGSLGSRPVHRTRRLCCL